MRAALFLVVACLGIPGGFARAEILCDSRPLQLFEYRDGLGEIERYIVVPYRLVNRESRAIRNFGRLALETAEGRHLNDGYRPLVQSAYCGQAGCEDPASVSTALALGMQIPARQNVGALAIFHVSGDLPHELRLSGCASGTAPRYMLDESLGVYAAAEPRSPVSTTRQSSGSGEARPLVLVSSSTSPDLP